MSSLIVSLEVVLPLFIMLALGYLVRRVKLVKPETFDEMNKLTFRVFLPLVIFRNIYTSDFSTAFNGKLILTGLCIVLVMFALAFGLVLLLEKDNRKRGVLIQALFRSNFIIFGLTVAMNLYGDDQCGPISMLITCIIPVFNVLAVVALESFRVHKGGEKKSRLGSILKGIVTNPLIIAAVVGMIVLLTGLRLPAMLEDTIGDLAGVATPLALVILGGSFEFKSVKTNIKPLIFGVAGRLVLMPLIFMPICIALGFRNVELLGLLVMLAAPPAVSSYTMAQQMGGDSELAGQLIVFGSLFSVFTIFLWIFVLTSNGFI